MYRVSNHTISHVYLLASPNFSPLIPFTHSSEPKCSEQTSSPQPPTEPSPQPSHHDDPLTSHLVDLRPMALHNPRLVRAHPPPPGQPPEHMGHRRRQRQREDGHAHRVSSGQQVDDIRSPRPRHGHFGVHDDDGKRDHPDVDGYGARGDGGGGLGGGCLCCV